MSLFVLLVLQTVYRKQQFIDIYNASKHVHEKSIYTQTFLTFQTVQFWEI